ncbi:MAG: type I-E CRISPR-associated protein Cas5/CasD [Thermoguttaceae bacterium]|nr:type I-E CRISPR-associated protein Cas5/CasD [Thermoguttaceae bacterium]
MIDKIYEVSAEIAGPTAIFTRPDSGSSFVSYPAPTFSAVTAMFSSVARLNTAYIKPTRVHICRPVVFCKYTTNYHGVLRNELSIKQGNPYQFPATVLSNVVYQLFGVVTEISPPPEPFNHLHYLQDKFNRRLKKGILFSTPVLGWREFVPDYFGPLRAESKPDESTNLEIPSMLYTVYDQPLNGKYSPAFVQNVEIVKGVLNYA